MKVLDRSVEDGRKQNRKTEQEWDVLFDGQPRFAEQSVDYTGSSTSFEQYVRTKAKERGIDCMVRIAKGGVEFQAQNVIATSTI